MAVAIARIHRVKYNTAVGAGDVTVAIIPLGVGFFFFQTKK
jgi:hypothetical protein